MKIAKIVASADPADYPYNCQIWHAEPDSCEFHYSGQGLFCKTLGEAYAYAREQGAGGTEAQSLTDEAAKDSAVIDYNTRPGGWEELEDCEAFWRSVEPWQLVEAMRLYNDTINRRESHDDQ